MITSKLMGATGMDAQFALVHQLETVEQVREHLPVNVPSMFAGFALNEFFYLAAAVAPTDMELINALTQMVGELSRDMQLLSSLHNWDIPFLLVELPSRDKEGYTQILLQGV